MRRAILSAALLGLVTVAAPAAAVETPITVHVLSQGAKFIGSSMGGVEVRLYDADSGDLLAEGQTRGGTGDTGRIMKQAHSRGAVLSTPGAARFETTLDLDRPARIRAVAEGPQAQAQAMTTASSTQWVLPGKGVTGGDGWRLTLPGFMVDLQTPGAAGNAGTAPATVQVTANVRMMCGCPITPGGLWDADAYEVAAMVYRDGEKLREVPLSYAGHPSQFATELTLDKPGGYEVTVYAFDPASGTTGLDKTTFAVE